MQAVIDSNKQFEARLSNKLSAQDLRDQADNFRNPVKSAAQIENEKRLEQEKFRETTAALTFAQNPAAIIDNENIINKKLI